jgi:hypothetical protein
MRIHKPILAITVAMSVVLAACSAIAQIEAAAPLPRASGKLSPDMVNKVSPVPAFMGQGEHLGKQWTIHVRSEGQMRHRVELNWAKEQQRRDGELFYRGTPGPSRGVPIVLDGTLDTSTGKKTIRVEIATEPCTDDAKVVHPQRAVISVLGETELSGCGELAVY